MFDPSSARLLKIAAQCNEMMATLARRVAEQADVLSAKSAIDIRSYTDRVCLELFVDAELSQGTALTWWIELVWRQSKWGVEAAVRIVHRDGQDLLQQVAAHECSSEETCFESLMEAAATLTAMSDVATLIAEHSCQSSPRSTSPPTGPSSS